MTNEQAEKIAFAHKMYELYMLAHKVKLNTRARFGENSTEFALVERALEAIEAASDAADARAEIEE